jgi:hypothetical protein
VSETAVPFYEYTVFDFPITAMTRDHGDLGDSPKLALSQHPPFL